MQMDHLKRGFFGYRKESVYRHIAEMEAEFSKRLMEKDAQAKQKEEELLGRIAALEAKVQSAEDECERHRSSQAAISGALLSAQAYADRLREQTLQEEEGARRRIAEREAEQARELDGYGEMLGRLRRSIHDLLEEMDGQVKGIQQEWELIDCQPAALGQEPPHQVMTLFQRKSAQGE